MNDDCKCPRVKCERHGNCIECQSFHSDEEKVINFCKWAKITGFNNQEPKIGLRAWLSNDRTPFQTPR